MHSNDHGGAPGLAAPKRLSNLDPVCLAPLGTAGTAAAGIGPPKSETARVASTGRIERQGTTDKGDFDGGAPDEQAALRDEGEEYAREYLARLHGGIAEPGELAVIVVFLRDGPMLEGICSAIERALEGTHHA